MNLKDKLSLEVDIIPPPAEWKLNELGEDPASYTHLNLNIKQVSLSEEAHGLIGYTQHLSYDIDGSPVRLLTCLCLLTPALQLIVS